jgi:hypothetical protein
LIDDHATALLKTTEPSLSRNKLIFPFLLVIMGGKGYRLLSFYPIDNLSSFEVMDIFDNSLTIDEPADWFYGMALAIGKRD